ncbi:patatin-like phospholipase domain-containing protein [Sediminicoccus rosea]|uniref:Patatin-like phospholipase n=1 Tax=Sediminicoccus rosea TaxID=1225128 RepID=A0ABZ0PQT0_9PROT|nr:hypothetical protein [Sediminicoccus rosea]WPB87460.1 hypothetical protein R9Z33_11390 [Sediminicoccus rosea]
MIKRMDTGSPWVVSNNPRGPYWEGPPDGSWMGTRHYNLPAIVRASTAAPGYFRPEFLRIAAGAPPGLFVDGGVSPYDNPSLPLLMLATARPYRLRWKMGPESLMMVSVGRGSFRVRMAPGTRGPAVGMVARALLGMIGDGQALSLTLMQWMSVTPAPHKLNSEIGDLADEFLGGVPLLRFLRYDLPLEAEWLEQELATRTDARSLAEHRRMDHPGGMSALRDIAERAAERQVRPEHYPACFDLDG